MKQAIKAALISGLVFPGTGHFAIHRIRRGMIFFVPAASSFLYLVRYSLDRAYAIADQIKLGQIPLDTETITSLITAEPGATELMKLQIATWLVIISWAVSIIDSYRIGKILDRTDNK